MFFPYWPSSDGDDAERRLPVGRGEGSEAGYALRWADEGDRVARRSADEWLVERAAKALARDPLVHGRRLEILVQNGVIILFGVLASVEARDAAGRRAWSVEGVLDVCNRLTVSEADAGGR